jgi:hypothetical protein
LNEVIRLNKMLQKQKLLLPNTALRIDRLNLRLLYLEHSLTSGIN